jgi:predicted AAA+ superfamily ATPase
MKHFPVVLLTGARQVGKSTLALRVMDNYITLDDIATYSSAKADPRSFIQGLKKPVVIDEVQKAPELLNAIKFDVDKKRVNGSFLLTGSTNIVAYKDIADTLAGRIAVLELLPLSCKEIAAKSENVIDILFSGNLENISLPVLDTKRMINQIINGGYPEVQKIDTSMGKYLWFSSYIRTYIERDVRDIGELRNLDKFIRMYNMLGPRSGNILNKSDIARDTGIEMKTLDNYLNLLELVYQIHILMPYSRNISKRFIKTGKLFFTDSGILSHLLGISIHEDFMTSHYKGSIFETFVFSEILKAKKYSDKPFNIFFYRTLDRKEIDFIIERGKNIIAIEAKFSKTVTKEDFKHIVALKDSVNNLKAGYVLYTGEQLLPFGNNLFALPLSILF